jgi:hypothetical protein
MGFQEGGQYLPGDYVDEGKLLLFIKDQVASRPPRKGQRLKNEQANRKRKKAESCLGLGPGPAKRQRGLQDAVPASRSGGTGSEDEDDDDEAGLSLILIYNSVQGYCSAINELWAHQTSRGLYTAPRPQRVAL